MVTALMNSKNPALVLGAPLGGAVGTNQLCRKATVPMTVSVAGGIPRTRLYVVGSNPGPAFEVPDQIDGHALAAALNDIRNGENAPTTEVDAFTRFLAAATEIGFERGVAVGQSLLGVS